MTAASYLITAWLHIIPDVWAITMILVTKQAIKKQEKIITRKLIIKYEVYFYHTKKSYSLCGSKYSPGQHVQSIRGIQCSCLS